MAISTSGAITFTAEGTYEITIAEQIPGSDDPEYDPDMTYDSHKLVYTVSVEDDHAGSLVATVDEDSISKGETTFRNILTPEDEKSVYSADDTDLKTEINGQLVGVGDKLTYTIDWVNNAQDSFRCADNSHRDRNRYDSGGNQLGGRQYFGRRVTWSGWQDDYLEI